MRGWLNLLFVSLCLTTMADPSAAAEKGGPSAEGGAETTMAVARVDINHASVEELCTLPGIGKKRAEAIVRYRERRPFTRVTQLLNIRGIGRKTLRKLRPKLAVTPMIAMRPGTGAGSTSTARREKGRATGKKAVERSSRGCARAHSAGGVGHGDTTSTASPGGSGSK